MAPVNLQIGERVVKSTDVTYEDLIELYRIFIQKFGHVPITTECTATNNLPQMRIINRVLREQGVTYKDFLGIFGKKLHARASSADYDIFVAEFKKYSDELGRPLTSLELVSEKYNLPSVKWFIKFCPNKNVKNYRDFVVWCGYDPCKKIWTKDEVAAILREYERSNERNVVLEDITTANMGFSTIVINRLFGSLENARIECGLMPLSPRYCYPPTVNKANVDSHYVDALKNVVLDYKNKTNSPYISWDIIESGKFGDFNYKHKTYIKHFKNANVDLLAFVKSLGCLMGNNSYSNSYIFDTGELVRSSLEYDFTVYLNKSGFIYKKDYQRDVRYRTFSNETGRIDCDYVIDVGGIPVYVEIAGVLDSSYGNTWDTYSFTDTRHIEYRNTLLKKRSILESIGAEYYFLFKDEMRDAFYKNIIDNLSSRKHAA